MLIYGSSRNISNTLKYFNLLLFGFGTLTKFILVWTHGKNSYKPYDET